MSDRLCPQCVGSLFKFNNVCKANQNKFITKRINAMEVDNSDEYFTSYENLEIHELMLMDRARNEAYKHAIVGNKTLFEVSR